MPRLRCWSVDLTCGLTMANREIREQRRVSEIIERQIQKDKRQAKMEVKLLLLGTGEAGKSTFLKQMRIIHGEGFSTKDRKAFVPLIRGNVLSAMQTMLQAMETLGIPLCFSDNINYLPYVQEGNTEEAEDDSLLQALKSLWEDPGIQRVFERRREYQLGDNTEYYMGQLDTIFSPDFVPTQQDVLHAREPTTGFKEYSFMIHKVTLRMVDVGGQRGERAKWLHCVSDVKSVMFLVALSEYDQTLFESASENRMKESMALFHRITGPSCPWFPNSSFVLFLNKTDLFDEKIMHTHLSNYFPDYRGPPRNTEAAKEYILEMFLEGNTTNRPIYWHFTCATDTENIRIVFEVIRDTILQSNLREFDLV